jgi:cellulose synthase/poly-beta-1,6-N-acetylglucosamine synthase-like glycosyltransferase
VKLSDHLTGTINSYKKRAIETALAFSTGELIVSTDADCIATPLWIQTIVSFYKQKMSKFIVMPVAYSSEPGFLSIFQQLDFMSLQGITGAAVNGKAMNMCNGANMAYSLEAFRAVDGFKNIDHIASGDDMLLMQKIATKYPDDVYFLKSKDVIIRTKPMDSLISFLNQRIRWASKATHYTDKRITAVLLIVYLLNLSLLAIPLICLFYNPIYRFGGFDFSILGSWLLLIILKTTAELYFLVPVAGFFGEKKLLAWFPLAQPFHILYTVIAGWLGKFGKYQWKGRSVK